MPMLTAYEAGLWLFWVTEREVIAVPRPVLRVRDDRLHCEDGPAVHWPEGAEYYFWRGVHVPKQIVLDPSSLTPAGILGERNAEVRRVMMERYGQNRFMLDAGARVIDCDDEHGAQLLSIDLPDDSDGRIVALKLRCPSTAAVYIVRVPPDQKKARAALAWSHGLKAGEYVLAKES